MRVFRFLLLPLFVVPLFGCQGLSEKVDHVDQPLKLSRDDYRDFYDQDPDHKHQRTPTDLNTKSIVPPVPDIAPLLAAPRPPKLGNTKLVSLAVTDDVPLRDVLIELARLADVDVELDSGIQGGINFRAKDRPFNEVVERIADMAGLRYSFKNGVLRVERDQPYVRNYPLDFLNIVRSSDSSVSISTDASSLSAVGGAGGGGGSGGGASSGNSGGGNSGGSGSGSGGLTTGSTASIKAKAEDDFWESLTNGIRAILLNGGSGITSADVGKQTTFQPANGASSAAGTAAVLPAGEFMVINRSAGMLSVAATQKQHDMIERYLAQVKTSASSQVLIEAKIVEVSLDDQFQSGIDWSKIGGKFNLASVTSPTFDASNVTTGVIGNELPSGALNNLGAGVGVNPSSSGLDIAVKLASQFGTTRTLSSPRLHAINNQPAVLTFAQNKVFFNVQLQFQNATQIGNTVSAPQTTVTSTRQTVPIGIIMSILPSIDLADNEVTLSVHPTLTRQVSQVTDPGSALISQQLASNGGATFTNTVPVIEVRELDSMLKLKSGQIMVIGGLMEQGSNNTDTGVPWLSDVPVLGNAFKGVTKDNTTKELIIFIRATIVNPNGNYAPADRLVYDKFTKDPRPLAF